MTFQVTVPKNTPEGDTVHISIQTQKNYKMEKVADFTFSVTLDANQLQTIENGTIAYRYSRNGYDFRTTNISGHTGSGFI